MVMLKHNIHAMIFLWKERRLVFVFTNSNNRAGYRAHAVGFNLSPWQSQKSKSTSL